MIEQIASYPYLAAGIMALLGACFGSFISLVSYRLPRGLPVVAVHSRCPSCQQSLQIPDLVPVLSWVVLRGRCRRCKARVSWRYPAIELVTAAVFVGLSLQVGLIWLLLPVLGLAVCLIALIVTDFEHYIIPDELQLAMLGFGGLYVWLAGLSWQGHVLGALLGLGLGLSLHYGFKWWRKKDGLGLGDVKLLGVAGLWLGALPLIPFISYAGLLGVVTAVFWRLMGRGERYPFGPSLACSLALCLFWPASADWFWHFQRSLWSL